VLARIQGSAIHRDTPKARINSEVARCEGAERPCYPDIRFIYGPKRTYWTDNTLATDARCSVTVYPAVLSFRVQHLNVRRTRSRLTGRSGNEHDPPLLGYLKRVLIPSSQCPTSPPEPRGSRSVLVRSIRETGKLAHGLRGAGLGGGGEAGGCGSR